MGSVCCRVLFGATLDCGGALHGNGTLLVAPLSFGAATSLCLGTVASHSSVSKSLQLPGKRGCRRISFYRARKVFVRQEKHSVAPMSNIPGGLLRPEEEGIAKRIVTRKIQIKRCCLYRPSCLCRNIVGKDKAQSGIQRTENVSDRSHHAQKPDAQRCEGRRKHAGQNHGQSGHGPLLLALQ